MYGHCVTDHAWEDRRRSCPSAYDTPLVRAVERLDLLLQFGVDIRPLLGRSRHEVTPRLLPLRGAAPHNHRVRALVVAGARLHRLSPLGLRLTTDRGFALAAAMRMVTRVHCRPADRWAPPTMPVATGLSNNDIFVVDVADLSQGCHAVEVDQPHLSRRHPHLRVVIRLCHQLCRCSGRAAHLTALTRIQFDVVDLRPSRNVAQRYGIASPDWRIWTGNHRVAHRQTNRSQHVALLAVHIVQQRDPCGPVRVVLDGGNFGRNSGLVPLEVDDSVKPLVPPTTMPGRDPAPVVATRVFL